MNYDSQCLCMILRGKEVQYLGAETWLIIGEHGQLLRYESFCLITVSYQLCSGLWDGVGVSTLPANLTELSSHLLHRKLLSMFITSVFNISKLGFPLIILIVTSFHLVHQQHENQLAESRSSTTLNILLFL